MPALWALLIAIAIWFPGHVADAVHVAWCESRFEPQAVNARSGARGLYQVRAEFWGEVPLDIAGQIEQAARISDGGRNWRPWACRP